MPAFPSTWVGRWKKTGHFAPYTDSKALMKCQYCLEDERLRNFRIIRSYRVKGCTEPGSTWEWWEGHCQNPNACWGPQPRFWTVLKTNTQQWVFRTEIAEVADPKILSNIDELRVTLTQGTGEDRLVYKGIATGRQCNRELFYTFGKSFVAYYIEHNIHRMGTQKINFGFRFIYRVFQ